MRTPRLKMNSSGSEHGRVERRQCENAIANSGPSNRSCQAAIPGKCLFYVVAKVDLR